MAYSVSNSLFVRNLSLQVTEDIVREVFAGCDAIRQVLFKTYPNYPGQFFAQIDFVTSQGVAEGSKLSGTNILGVPCVCGVIDPVLAAQPGMAGMPGIPGPDGIIPQVPPALTAESIAQMAQQRQQQMADDQLYRSVHVAGIKKGLPLEQVIGLCRNFGEVITGRLDFDPSSEPFALVEFREAAQAHACKVQARCFFEGQLVTFSQAKTVVDPTLLAEQSVSFENGLMAPMNHRSMLATQDHLSNKLAQVQAAAAAILSGDTSLPAPERRPRKSPKGSRSRSGSSSEERRKIRHREKGKEKEKKPKAKAKAPSSSSNSSSSSDSSPKRRKGNEKKAKPKDKKRSAERPRSLSRRGRRSRSRDRRR